MKSPDFTQRHLNGHTSTSFGRTSSRSTDTDLILYPRFSKLLDGGMSFLRSKPESFLFKTLVNHYRRYSYAYLPSNSHDNKRWEELPYVWSNWRYRIFFLVNKGCTEAPSRLRSTESTRPNQSPYTNTDVVESPPSRRGPWRAGGTSSCTTGPTPEKCSHRVRVSRTGLHVRTKSRPKHSVAVCKVTDWFSVPTRVSVPRSVQLVQHHPTLRDV